MGVTANIHRNFEPQHRAQAENIAALRLAAVGDINNATSRFDLAGHHYWRGEQGEATDATQQAFSLLRGSKEKLEEASRLSVPLTGFHVKSPKTEKAEELYLGGYEYSPENFTAQLLVWDRRLIGHIEHLLVCETMTVESMGSGNIEACYSAVSAPSRELVVLSGQYAVELIRIATLAHEVSDVVVAAWETEGTTPADFRRGVEPLAREELVASTR